MGIISPVTKQGTWEFVNNAGIGYVITATVVGDKANFSVDLTRWVGYYRSQWMGNYTRYYYKCAAQSVKMTVDDVSSTTKNFSALNDTYKDSSKGSINETAKLTVNNVDLKKGAYIVKIVDGSSVKGTFEITLKTGSGVSVNNGAWTENNSIFVNGGSEWIESSSIFGNNGSAWIES